MATIIKNTLQPLPIYASMEDWYENKRRGNGVCRHTIVSKNSMIPFFVTTDYTPGEVHYNVKKKGETYTYASLDLIAHRVEVGDVGGMKTYYVWFDGPILLEEGLYYMEIEWSATRKFYSEVFKAENPAMLMRIDYSHSKQIATQDGSVLMFDDTTERPLTMWLRPEGGNVMSDWQTEESVDGRDGYQMVERRDMWKQHSITLLANEYTVDALMMMWVRIDYQSKDKSKTFSNVPDVSVIRVTCSNHNLDFSDSWEER